MTSRTERHREIDEYLDALHQLGDLSVDGTTLRRAVTVDQTDYWAASSLRESSPWTTPAFAAISALRALVARSEDQQARLFEIPSAQRRLSLASVTTTRIRTLGYWLANLTQCTFRNSPRLTGTVVLVVYLPAGNTIADADSLARRYFGELPEMLASNSVAYSVLLLPTESRPVSRRARRRAIGHRVTTAVVLSSFALPGALWSAFCNWRALQRRLPRPTQFISRSLAPKVQALTNVMSRCVNESFYGTIAARTSLYTELFSRALQTAQDAQLVVYPFEGQGWETTLEQAAKACGVATLPYLHTVMKPWDLRAHTALRECPPRGIWVHGSHDEAELSRHGTALHRVEALRYQYLGNARATSEPARAGHQVLVILGADCERSRAEMHSFCEAVRRLQPSWQLRVRLHPQCSIDLISQVNADLLSSGSLSDDLEQCSASFLCGTAAPLDSYLFGLPTVALQSSDGFNMNPLEADDRFAYADSVDHAVQWLTDALGLRGVKPDIAKFFDIAVGLPRWNRLISSLHR